MFGTYRTILAFWIAAQHLIGQNFLGESAVFGFYIMSGYLMTLIMQRNYGYDRSGVARYAVNRWLRIYPVYWISILLSLLLIWTIGPDVTIKFQRAFFLPDTLREWAQNILLILEHDTRPRLTPPAWALTVEVFFYIAIGLGASRSRRLTCIWLTLSALFHAVGLIMGLGFFDRYFPVHAASLPFASGAFIYHYRTELTKLLSVKNPTLDTYLPILTLMLLLFSSALPTQLIEGYPMDLSFYLNWLLAAALMVVLIDRPLLPIIPKKLDKLFGDLSYAIYLIHWQMGLLVYTVVKTLGFDVYKRGLWLYLAAMPLVFLVAWVIDKSVGAPIDQLRDTVKKDSHTPKHASN